MSADNKQGVDVTQLNNKDGEFVRKGKNMNKLLHFLLSDWHEDVTLLQ